MLSGARRGPGWSSGGCGNRGGLAVTDEVPCTVEDTIGFRGEEVEETTRQVKAAVGAPGALVHDLGIGGLPVVSHGDHFEAVGTGVSVTELLNNQGQATAVTMDRAVLHTGVLRATIKSLATLF